MIHGSGSVGTGLLAAAVSCAWIAALITAGGAAAAEVPRIDVVGTLPLPDRADVADGSTVGVTGVSGVAWLGADRWVAVMDTGVAWLSFALDLGPDGAPRGVTDVRAVRFAERHDYEDVVPCPPAFARRCRAAAGTLIVCEEDTPALWIVDPAGTIAGGLPVPRAFAARHPNRGLEALAAAADGAAVWTANEEALPGDGPLPEPGTGTVVRIAQVSLDVAGGRHGRQIAYAVDPPHACVPRAIEAAYSGVVALAALPDGRLLVLERSAARCLPPFENRIYVVDAAAAPDVADIARDLATRPDVHAAKRLAWRGGLGCNLEGLALGPALAAGGTAVVAVADSGGLQMPSQLVVLRLDPPLTSP